jgi:hypothetical protein
MKAWRFSSDVWFFMISLMIVAVYIIAAEIAKSIFYKKVKF